MWVSENHRVLIVADAKPSAGLRPAFLRTAEDIDLQSCPRDESALIAARDGHPSLIIEDHPGYDAPDPEICARLKRDDSTRTIPLIVVAPRGHNFRGVMAPDATVFKPIVQREYYDAVSRFIPLARRRCLRHAINLRFSYRGDGIVGQAFTRDLSLHGAFLKTDRTLELGARLEVTFHLPGQDDPLECGAIVRRTAPYAIGQKRSNSGFAIEFEGIGEADLQRLETFIEQHLQKPLFSF